MIIQNQISTTGGSLKYFKTLIMEKLISEFWVGFFFFYLLWLETNCFNILPNTDLLILSLLYVSCIR